MDEHLGPGVLRIRTAIVNMSMVIESQYQRSYMSAMIMPPPLFVPASVTPLLIQHPADAVVLVLPLDDSYEESRTVVDMMGDDIVSVCNWTDLLEKDEQEMLSIASGSDMLMDYSVVIASSWSYIVVSRIKRGCTFLVPDKLAHNTCYDFMQYHVVVRNEIDASGHTVDVSDCGMVSAILYYMLCDTGVVSVETHQDTGDHSCRPSILQEATLLSSLEPFLPS